VPTDYFTPISNAVARLRPNTADARRSIYDQARQLLLDEAKNGRPPMAVSELIAEQRTLEQAIQMVEAHAAFTENSRVREQETRERSAGERQLRERDTREHAAGERANQLREKEMRRIGAEQRHAQRQVQRHPQRRPGRRKSGGSKTALIVAGALTAVFLLAGVAAYFTVFGWPSFRASEAPPPAKQEAPSAPKPEEQAAKLKNLLARASSSLEKGNPLEAIVALNEAVLMAPSDINVFTLRGHAYLQGNDLDRAIEDFSEAIRLGSRDFYAFIGRGVAYRRKRDFQRSIADYDEAIRIQPDHAGAWNNRCFVHAIGGNLDNALSDCNEALRLMPNEPNSLDSRALVYMKLKQYDRAIADYDAVLKIVPNTPSALYGRGLAKLKKGDKRGQADISTATTAAPAIAQEFERYGVK
jgi:tetratricopeptide (TPR) repeat protein